MTLRQVAAPTAEPITLDQARIHLRQATDGATPSDPSVYLESLPDASWVTAAISAARQHAENFLGYPLTDATYEATFDAFEAVMRLPEGASTVTDVKYLDASNVEQTLSNGSYSFDPLSGLYITTPPGTMSTRTNSVRVRFKGGLTPSTVPEAIRLALMLLIGHWYSNREASASGMDEMPFGVEALLRPYRVQLGMA